MSAKRAALIERVERAFGERDGIPHPLVRDTSATDPECKEIAAAFVGLAPRDLSAEFIEDHAQSLFFLSPAAFAYYLPAYLRAALTHPEATPNATDAVLFALERARTSTDPAHPLVMAWAMLSDEERVTVAACEAHLRAEEDEPPRGGWIAKPRKPW